MSSLGSLIIIILSNVFIIYKHFERTDTGFDKKIGINSATCELKHRVIDGNFIDIASELRFIKENHLAHMEKDISDINKCIAVILDRQQRNQIKNNANFDKIT